MKYEELYEKALGYIHEYADDKAYTKNEDAKESLDMLIGYIYGVDDILYMLKIKEIKEKEKKNGTDNLLY